jgi:RNA polymerase sigma factor (sigma-70 family)
MIATQRTDEDLLASYQAGDQAAFDDLYRRLAPRVEATVAKRLPPRHRSAVDDVCQEVWIKAASRASTYTPGRKVSAWLAGITKTEIVNYRRRCRNRLCEAEPLYGDAEPVVVPKAPDRDQIAAETVAEISQAITERLSPETASAFRLVYFYGVSVPHVAIGQGVPVKTLYDRLGQAKKTIQAAICE